MTNGAIPKDFWAALPALAPGWVWLVGGGPGDPGLITALGLKALAEADVILHDALIDERLLALAQPDAERIYAGKRAGVKSCKQDEISDELIRNAQAGKRVLRLLVEAKQKMGKTVIIITHNAAIAQVADRVIRFRSGEIVERHENAQPTPPEEITW